ncbi:hypothetical protein AGLY_014106 [Aphis glycines]|uniref:Uncharacterized protein n=1 Tax=Aphis glycines TaxID=307491 RepID=A0A6G0T4S6_APHGL|nr:hypothetical protein AGLY_014106 [Aphis glycines]
MYNIKCIQCLTYARENGCPWYVTTCANAAKTGHLKCLKYAKNSDYLKKNNFLVYVYRGIYPVNDNLLSENRVKSGFRLTAFFQNDIIRLQMTYSMTSNSFKSPGKPIRLQVILALTKLCSLYLIFSQIINVNSNQALHKPVYRPVHRIEECRRKNRMSKCCDILNEVMNNLNFAVFRPLKHKPPLFNLTLL